MRADDAIDLRRQEWLWLLAALATPLFVNFWVEQQFEASKVWLLRPLIWLLALLWLVGWVGGARRRPLPALICRALLAFALVLGLSTLLSTHPFVALAGSLERANGLLTQLSYLLLFAVVATRIDGESSRGLLTAVLLTSVPIGLLGLAQAAGWQPLPLITDARTPLTTTLGRANFTGAYLALLLPLTLTAARLTPGRVQRGALLTLLALEAIVIFLTGARAAAVAAVAGLGLLFWLWTAPRLSRRVQWASALVSGTVFVAGLVMLLHRGLAAGGSIAARWTIWEASLRLLWPRLWLGYGLDTLEIHFPTVYPPQLVYYQGRGVVVDRAHNWLLDGALGYGIVGTLILVFLVLVVFRRGWRYVAGDGPGGPARLERLWVAAALAAAGAHLVGTLFLFEVAATAVLFWLLLALVTAATARPLTPSVALHRPRAWRTTVLLVGLAVWGVATWQFSGRPMLADGQSWRGTQALGAGDLITAREGYAAAAAYQPRRAAYHVATGLTAAQMDEWEGAEAALETAVTLRPEDPAVWTHVAAIHGEAALAVSDTQRLAAAYDAYKRAIALAPTLAVTYRQYADLAFRAGDPSRAAVQAARAVDLDATDGSAFSLLGWSRLALGDAPAAQDAFQEAVRWAPQSADAYLGLATAHYEQGAVDAARAAVAASLARNPGYTPALNLQLQLSQ